MIGPTEVLVMDWKYHVNTNFLDPSYTVNRLRQLLVDAEYIVHQKSFVSVRYEVLFNWNC